MAAVYHGRGVVKAVNLEKGTVRISHEKIEGYMEAMTMDYRVKDASLLDSVKVGEGVDFTLKTGPGRHRSRGCSGEVNRRASPLRCT